MEIVKLQTLKDIQTFSSEVKKFIHTNRLWTNVQGKPYVNVEGWQFMGGMMGITANVKELECLNTETEIKYRAVVELYKGELLISSGVAICTNTEQGKKSVESKLYLDEIITLREKIRNIEEEIENYKKEQKMGFKKRPEILNINQIRSNIQYDIVYSAMFGNGIVL